jgi:uncharacterized protein YPO0396
LRENRPVIGTFGAGQVEAQRAREGRTPSASPALPEFALAMRDHICASVGADVAALPYIAELLDLKPDQARWRLAVEKVLRGAGLRLLVPDQHWAAVLRFVNETDMRGRLQLHHVRAKFLGAEPVDPEPNTLAGKLFAVDPKHPCAAEAVDVITAAGDHICVDTPDVFARFRRAVTDTGLYKDSDRLAVKDDRRPVKQSEYLYQGDVTAKINALRLELATAELADELLKPADAFERLGLQHSSRFRHAQRGTWPCRRRNSTRHRFADVSGMSALPRHCADSPKDGAAVKHEAHGA